MVLGTMCISVNFEIFKSHVDIALIYYMSPLYRTSSILLSLIWSLSHICLFSFFSLPLPPFLQITQPVEGVTSSESSVDKPAMSDAFGEFVQYTDTDDRSFKTAANQPKHTLMQACVTSFQVCAYRKKKFKNIFNVMQ